MRPILILTLIFLCPACRQLISLEELKDSDNAPEVRNHLTKIRTAFYPYIPNRELFLQIVRNEFTLRYPDYDFEDVLLDHYYDPEHELSIYNTVADVIEIDSSVVEGMRNHLAPIQIHSDSIQASDFFNESLLLYNQNMQIIGVPHWLCSHFVYASRQHEGLFYSDFLSYLKSSETQFVADFMGKTTVGELIYNMALDMYKYPVKVNDTLSYDFQGGFQREVFNYFDGLMKQCLPYCRNTLHHGDTGFFASHFLDARDKLLVGYSELLYDVLTVSQQKLNPKDELSLYVYPLILSESGDQPFVWSDYLGVNKNTCHGECLTIAEKLLLVVNDPKVILDYLINSESNIVYVLSARKDVQYELMNRDVLYRRFYSLLEGAQVGIGSNLNVSIRSWGKRLDDFLPTHTESIVGVD